MPASDPLEILLAHDRWATRQTLDACSKLSDEQFHRRFDMGPGSLHDTLTHILAAMRVWGDLLAGREQRPRLEGTQRTVAELTALHDEIAPDLAASARAHPLEETVSRIREGKTYQFTRGAVLMQVTTHAMHHRAQCLNMLRQAGVNPLPPSSVVEWTRLGEPAA
jgi:uncharacterized damage-inducible protein DinB